MKKLQKTPFEKFKNSMKRAGYDMDAGAKRLQDLLDKQKKEREEREMNSTKSEEASPMIKPPKNEFAKKEDAFAHARQHGGKVMKKTFIHPTSGMKNVSYVVKEETEIDEASKKPNATTRHLRQYPVSDKDVAKPITYYSLVHKATNKVLSTHKDLESAKDEHRGMDQGERAHFRIATSTKAPKSFSMKEDAELDEAIKKPNATTRFLRQYPVSDKEMPKPVKQSEYQHHVVSKLDGNVLASYKSKEAAHRNAYGNPVVSGSLETIGDRKYVREQGVAEAAFKDPSPMMKDSIKQDRIRSLRNLMSRYEEKAIAANRAGDDAKTKQYQKRVQQYKQELGSLVKEGVAEVTEAGPFSYGAKPPRKGSVAYNALMKRKEQDRNRVKEIEAIGTKNHHVGVAKVTKEDIEDVAETYKYIDQSGGQVIKGKSGTYVGYTHSATKGKGANILKHNDTKKYYAAGGSSTAFTQKTTLHDTPQAAAKAYHKGNLAEEFNYGKSFKELREAAFNSNCCPDEEYGFTEEQFTVTGTEQYEDWGEDIVEGKLSFSKLSQKLHEEDGKNVKLNKPFLTPGGPKKRAVYVKNDKGNTVKVSFGDPNMEIRRDDPERRASFRARHGCDNPGPKWKAKYWSCKFWSSTPVSKL